MAAGLAHRQVVEQFGQITGGNMQAVLDALGVGDKPIARVIVAVTPLLRPSKAYGVPCAPVSVKRLAEIAFNGDKGNASKAIKKAVDSGALMVVSPSSGKGSPAVYALGVGCKQHTESVQPILGCKEHTANVQPKEKMGCKNARNGLYESNTDKTTTHRYSYKKGDGGGIESAPSPLCPKCGKQVETVAEYGKYLNVRCVNPSCSLYGDNGYTFTVKKAG